MLRSAMANPVSVSKPTSTKPRPERCWQIALAPAIATALLLAACAAPVVALLPVTPLLAATLGSRGGDTESRQQIVELQKRGDWQGLEAFAQSRITQNPKDEDSWILLGYAQLQLGKPANAMEALTLVTRLSPEEIDGWNLLAEAQRLTGRYDQALSTLDHANAIDPTSAVSQFLRGEVHRDTGRLDAAENAYRTSIQLQPELAPAWYGLGMTLKRTGQRDELPKIMEALQQLNPPLAAMLAASN